MDDTAEVVSTPTNAKKRRNWWKVAFFVLLIVFEITREFAVIGFAQRAEPNSPFYLGAVDTLVSATGSWKRIDGGGKMMPAAIKIECWQDRGICIEASSNGSEHYFYAPELDWFDATFTPEAVTYENDLPDCAKYSVRLDLKMNKVFAVRQRKENPTNPNCAKLEDRIELQLGDGYEYRNPGEDHFLPILNGVGAIFKAFDNTSEKSI